MKMQYLFVRLMMLGLAGLVACAPSGASDPMAGLLGRIPQLALPYTAHLNSDGAMAEELAVEADAAWFAPGTPLIGWMRPSDTVVAVLYVAVGADYPLPALRTFVQGRQVDDRVLGLGACGGGDCGFTCEEHFRLAADGRFSSEARTEVHACDAAGQPTERLLRSSTARLTGSVDQAGRITAATTD